MHNDTDQQWGWDYLFTKYWAAKKNNMLNSTLHDDIIF